MKLKRWPEHSRAVERSVARLLAQARGERVMVDGEFARTDRVADAIQRILSRVIQHKMRDPRVHMVNINAVTVTRDIAYAKVYVTLIGDHDDEACNSIVDVLNRASGFLRSCVSRELATRITPKFQFIYDTTPVHGQQLSDLIDRVVTKDTSIDRH